MLYKMNLSKKLMVALVERHYPDIYPVCREQVFMAKLNDKAFPTITASLSFDDWDELVEEYGVFEEDDFPDSDGVYEGQEVVWFAESPDENQPLYSDRLNIFLYRDRYKELR